ncbi:hypothetical protein ES703_37875 [subsurface metagenome]
MRYFQLIRITGSANAITYDDGLKSTEAEKKRLVACHIEMEKYAATDDNDVQGYHERAKVFDIPEKMFPVERETAITSAAASLKMTQVPVDLDLPAGETFKLALKCAATLTKLRGAYEYEIIS